MLKLLAQYNFYLSIIVCKLIPSFGDKTFFNLS